MAASSEDGAAGENGYLERANGVSATASAADGPTQYVGSTSQGLPVELLVTPQGVYSFSFYWRARCADGLIHANGIDASPRFPAQISSTGRFALKGVLNTGGRFTIRGAVFKGAYAAGRLSRSGSTAFGTECVARGLKWQTVPIG